MFVKPAPGRAARDPLTRTLLAEQGEEKPDTRFWRRRLRDEDVELCEPPEEPKLEPIAPEQAVSDHAEPDTAHAAAEEH